MRITGVNEVEYEIELPPEYSNVIIPVDAIPPRIDIYLNESKETVVASLMIIPLIGPVWVVAPPGKVEGDMFSVAVDAASIEGLLNVSIMADRVLIPDRIAAVIVANMPKRFGYMTVTRILWCPRADVSGMATKEFINLTSLLPMSMTCKLARGIKINILNDEV